jgi:NAD+ synthase (glutamine-hydrolysing)
MAVAQRRGETVPTFSLGLAQINTVLGDMPRNLEHHLDIIASARKDGVELLAFPELSLTGYLLQDMVPEVALAPDQREAALEPLLRASREIDLLIGFVDMDARSRTFIASAYLSAGRIVQVHHKAYLPTYGLFDEGRFFAPGEDLAAFDTRFGRVGVLICEEFWHVSSPYLLWLDGADLMLFMSASPVRGLTTADQLESVAWVERVNQAYAGLFTCHVAHVVRVGFEDGLVFGGRSTIFDPKGELMGSGPDFEEGLVIAEVDPDQARRTRIRLPLLRDERADWVERQLHRLRHSDFPGKGRADGA